MSTRTKLTKAIAASLFPIAFGMVLAALLIHLVDRFKGNDTIRSFYMEERGVTCFVIKTRGQQLLSCLPGQYPEEGQ